MTVRVAEVQGQPSTKTVSSLDRHFVVCTLRWRADAPATPRQRELDDVGDAPVEAVQASCSLMAQHSVGAETQQPSHLSTADRRRSTTHGVHAWHLGHEQTIRHRSAKLAPGERASAELLERDHAM